MRKSGLSLSDAVSSGNGTEGCAIEGVCDELVTFNQFTYSKTTAIRTDLLQISTNINLIYT
jgi:hypothetical protein